MKNGEIAELSPKDWMTNQQSDGKEYSLKPYYQSR